ncbi:MAG TPA: DUF4390 domain-containing protein [Steroidobacteraceae bacterium]|nr:DUF4390 domain-containing protein [Steroidobacteraceae bacterium]
MAASLRPGREARDRPRLRRGPSAFQLLLLLAWAGFGYVPESLAQSRFEIRSAYVERAEGVYQLNATLDFQVAEGARAAIRDGAPFTLHLEIVVRRERSLWLDEVVATLDQNYELIYHALSDRYLVRNVNSGEQVSYATLDAAFDALRVISNLPILDQALVQPERRHEISLRAGLDVRTMPDTLRFILFWSDDWRQRSEWYTWSPRL